jgi:hypothetical protein
MFEFTKEQVDRVSILLCKMILTISNINDMDEPKMNAIHSKVISDIEKVINNQHVPSIYDDTEHPRLDLQ